MTPEHIGVVVKSLGFAGGLYRQREAIEFVLAHTDQPLEDLFKTVKAKGTYFSEVLQSATKRMVTKISEHHNEHLDENYYDKFLAHFPGQESKYINFVLDNKYVHLASGDLWGDEKLKACITVIQKSAHHWLKDVENYSEYKSDDELDQQTARIYELWKAGFLQCDLGR